MERDLYIVLGSAIYTITALRAAFVFHRASVAAGDHTGWFISGFFGLIWPLIASGYGMIVFMTGDPGIYRHSLPSKTRGGVE